VLIVGLFTLVRRWRDPVQAGFAAAAAARDARPLRRARLALLVTLPLRD